VNGRELQAEVDLLVHHIGGYWQVLSAVARLLEEVAEVATALDEGDEDQAVVELADVVVIGTCLANQYGVAVPDLPDEPVPGRGGTSTLLRCAGTVARTANHYEGDKRPKPGEELAPLAVAIPDLQDAAASLAGAFGRSLAAPLRSSVRRSTARDATRFDGREDPVHAEAARRWAARAGRGDHIADRAAWGGPAWDLDRSVDANAARQAPPLRPFVAAAGREGIDVYVVEVPTSVPPLAAVAAIAAAVDERIVRRLGAPQIEEAEGGGHAVAWRADEVTG
jgi:hypothetical protein